MEETKTFKYVLKWSGRKDSELVQLAFAYCKSEVPICRDTCKFVDYERYMNMVKNGVIEPPTTYWKIEPGEVGMVCYASYATSYAQSWEHLSMCYRDFIAGYTECEKKYKYLRDWEDAIVHNSKRDRYLRKIRRTITFSTTEWDSHINPIYSPQSEKTNVAWGRNGSTKITITDTCTGPEFEYLVYSVISDCRIPMPEMEPDPRREETKNTWHFSSHGMKKAKVAKH